MDPLVTFIIYAIVLVVVSMAGAIIPYIRELEDREAHLLVALSTGIFLGLLFFLLLPEALEECEHGGYDTHTVMYALFGGFALIMVIEFLMKHRHMSGCSCQCCEDSHSHKITSMSSFIGLAIHAACDGMALAATFLAGEEIGLIATVGMCIHKFVVLFSLSSTMLLTDIDTRGAMRNLLLFSLITPIAGIVFYLAFSGIAIDDFVGLPLAFAAGTFMYVALCDMLPEAFHRKNQDVKSFVLLIVGIVVIAIISLAFPHTH